MSDGGGLRYDKGKTRYDLIPPEWEHALAEILTAGAAKYDARNWERGMPWSKMVGCARRHLYQWLRGESYDKETHCHHLAHVAWNVLALMSYQLRTVGENDLPEPVMHATRVETLPVPVPPLPQTDGKFYLEVPMPRDWREQPAEGHEEVVKLVGEDGPAYHRRLPPGERREVAARREAAKGCQERAREEQHRLASRTEPREPLPNGAVRPGISLSIADELAVGEVDFHDDGA